MALLELQSNCYIFRDSFQHSIFNIWKGCIYKLLETWTFLKLFLIYTLCDTSTFRIFCFLLCLLLRFFAICSDIHRTGRLQPPTPSPLLAVHCSHSISCTTFCMLTCFPYLTCFTWCSLQLLFLSLLFFFLATVCSIRKTGAMVKASHCRQMLFSLWHDASSRSHFHCDCRAPSESIDNPCQALAPPTGASTAS